MSHALTTPSVSACHAAIFERGLATAPDAATLKALAKRHASWLLPADAERLRPAYVAAARRLGTHTESQPKEQHHE